MLSRHTSQKQRLCANGKSNAHARMGKCNACPTDAIFEGQ